MNSNTVDLIATDPPFNKGRDFHATPESLASGAKFQDRWSWETDIHESWQEYGKPVTQLHLFDSVQEALEDMKKHFVEEVK